MYNKRMKILKNKPNTIWKYKIHMCVWGGVVLNADTAADKNTHLCSTAECSKEHPDFELQLSLSSTPAT